MNRGNDRDLAAASSRQGMARTATFTSFMSGNTPMAEIYLERVTIHDATSRSAGPMPEIQGPIEIGSLVLAVATNGQFMMGTVAQVFQDRITVKNPHSGNPRLTGVAPPPQSSLGLNGEGPASRGSRPRLQRAR